MKSVFSATVLVCLFGADPVLALDLQSEQGFLFDIYETVDGYLSNGSIDAYDGAYYLDVDGIRYNPAGEAAPLNMDGRGVKMALIGQGDLRIRRYIWVPKSAGDFARFLDVVTNIGLVPISTTLTISGNLGSDGATVMPATSSGDLVLTPVDSWFTTDDTDASGDPSLAHVFQGDSPRVRASYVGLDRDNFSWRFVTAIPGGGRVALLTFAVQKPNQLQAQAEAARLATRPAYALEGLDEFLDDIINL